MSTSPFLATLETEAQTLMQQFPDLAPGLEKACAILREQRLFMEESGREAVVHSSTRQQWYTVNGHCTCKAAQYYDKPCCHRLALRLYQRVADAMVAADERWEPVDTPAPVVAHTDPLPAAHVVQIQGKAYIRYAGLLSLAHQRGLQALRAAWTYNDAELSLAHAVAVFPFGTFEDSGDATAANCSKTVAGHFRRVALTRAKARVLRDAFGLDMVAVEELGEEPFT